MPRIVPAALLALAVSGCAMTPLPVPSASIKAVAAVDAARLVPLAVGGFAADAAVRSRDASMGVRAAVIRPETGSFAVYLGETLKRQLLAAGRLDPMAPTVISGRLTENDVSSDIGTGHAVLGAEFVMARCGHDIFRKHLDVRQSWNSNFIGGIAIPAAELGYASLHSALIERLLADPDFVAAARMPADGVAPAACT